MTLRLRLDLQDARAMVATKDAAIDAMAVVINARDATIERVRAIVDDPHAALVLSRVRAALEPTS